MRRMPPFSATSSPLDDPGRLGYLHTFLSTLSNSDAVSEVDSEILRELAQSQCNLPYRDCASLREVAISTSDTASELRDAQREAWRYTQCLVSSIGDEMVENDALWRMGPNRLCGSYTSILLDYLVGGL